MKKYISIALMSLFALTSCEKEAAAPAFDITVDQNEAVKIEGDTIFVTQGSPIKFNFDGNPDNISFFSGEPGYKYEFRNRTDVVVENSVLTGYSGRTYGTNLNPERNGPFIKLYYSYDYQGITNDFTKDSTNLEQMLASGKWIEMLNDDDNAHFDSGRRLGTSTPTIPVEGAAERNTDYRKRTYTLDREDLKIKGYFRIAFRIDYPAMPYGTNNNAFGNHFVTNLKITSKAVDTGEDVTLGAAQMGFTPIYLTEKVFAPFYNNSTFLGKKPNNPDSYVTFDPYQSYASTMPAVDMRWWFVDIGRTTSIFKFQGGNSDVANNPLFDTGYVTWAISDPIDVNKCSPDVAIAIKDITKRVSQYEYTYKDKGVYNITFTANNARAHGGLETIKHMVISVK